MEKTAGKRAGLNLGMWRAAALADAYLSRILLTTTPPDLKLATMQEALELLGEQECRGAT